MFWAIYGIVIFAGLAMMVREGLWSNTITLINIIVSGLVAFGFYSPLVVYLDEQVTDGQHTYWLDFAILWALFCVTMIVMRTIMGMASKTRMRFKHPIDPVGGPIVGLFAAWVLAGFVIATLHASPMPLNAFGGNLVRNVGDSPTIFTAPDIAWLRFVDSMSQGRTMGTHHNERWAQAYQRIYADHRAKFDASETLIVKRGAR